MLRTRAQPATSETFMRFSHIEAFRAVMLSGSTTAAAKTLHTSQPNISRSIAQLEQSTGLRLFDRMPGRIVPTNDGLAFFKEVQRSFTGLLYLKDAANRIRRFSGGSLSLAAVQILAMSLVPRAVKELSAEFPESSISINIGHSSAVEQWVDDQTCDIGMVSHVNDAYGLKSEKLYEVDAVCIMPKEHHLTKHAAVSPEDLVDEPFISLPQNEFGQSSLEEVFENAGVLRQVSIRTSYSLVTCALVAQGLGVAIVNPIAALEHRGKNIVTRPFHPAVKHHGYLVYRPDRQDDRMILRLSALLKTIIERELEVLLGQS
ncbi:LysR substrate-binding domain-containing protein [uncultured Paracoccus sp.]|uniref:LysR substrate-binding domain-containing protein n=1 Tax=uncultured Paracoccus sp. TaxID=189685 RepID=UPI00260CFE10|nr:LysR substrate-binding domain-containing protein [uncultured Paracoccus sp.]